MQSDAELEVYCTIDEVKQLLSNLQVNKASGPDDVSSYMLKYVATSIAPSITQFFNQSINSYRTVVTASVTEITYACGRLSQTL